MSNKVKYRFNDSIRIMTLDDSEDQKIIQQLTRLVRGILKRKRDLIAVWKSGRSEEGKNQEWTNLLRQYAFTLKYDKTPVKDVALYLKLMETWFKQNIEKYQSRIEVKTFLNNSFQQHKNQDAKETEDLLRHAGITASASALAEGAKVIGKTTAEAISKGLKQANVQVQRGLEELGKWE